MARALATGIEDGRLFMHAAVIADRRGDTGAAGSGPRRPSTATTLFPSEITQLDLVRQRVAGRP